MASLDISLKDIPAEGLDLDCRITRLDLDLGEGDPGFKADFEFAARIHATEGEAWVVGELRGTLIHDCVRCLRSFHECADIPITACYRIQEKSSIHKAGRRGKHQEVETEDEEIESYPIIDDQFNLAEMLREQLILSVPIQPLCGEQCQGLCQVCGQYLNLR